MSQLAGVRVLVTGGAGRLARALVAALAREGARVWAPPRGELDLATADLEALEGFSPRWVLHPAGCTQVDLCEREPQRAERDNVLATRRLVEWCSARQVPGIFVSTDYVFGQVDGPFDEAGAPAPINHYGHTKLAAERAALETGWAVARTAWLWGDGEGFPAWVVEQGRRHGSVTVAAQVGTPTRVEELARALVGVGPGAQGIYHLVGGEALRRSEWALRSLRRAGLPHVAVVERPLGEVFAGAARRPYHSVLLNTRPDAPRLSGYSEGGFGVASVSVTPAVDP